MIPRASITAWRKAAPWPDNTQVEQDLFDLDLALGHPAFDGDRLLEAFERYMAFGGARVTRAQFEANMAAKLTDPAFLTDVPPLLRTSLEHDATAAWSRVHTALVSRLPGDPWRGDGDAR